MLTCPRVPLSSLTREAFEERFQRPNLPVLIEGATAGWRAARDWVTPAGTPDLEALGRLFGQHEVTVHGSSKQTQLEMTVAEYATWWAARLTATSGAREMDSWLYLKDWHLNLLEPSYVAYETPTCLGEDWLNEHWAANRLSGTPEEIRTSTGGDHRFVYVGPAQSRTALHADVLYSYSWSANVVGTKRWLLVPAEQRHLVSDAATRPLKPDLAMLMRGSAKSRRDEAGSTSGSGGDGVGVGSSDNSPSKRRRVAGGGTADKEEEQEDSEHVTGGVVLRPIEVVQRAGELLFVPSGWFHQVENLEDTISINHNWLTAHNAHWALARIEQVLADVKRGLGEDADDVELCEQLVERRVGMSLCGYCELLEGVLSRRCRRLRYEPKSSSEHRSHMEFACERAAAVLADALALLEAEYAVDELEPQRIEAIERQRELLRCPRG